MRATLFNTLALACLSVPLVPQGQASNVDFEGDELGSSPSGWHVAGAAPQSYLAEVNGEQPHAGRGCALLAHVGEEEQASWGTLMQSLDASSWRGKSVRLRAAVRTERDGPDSCAQLWLRVDRPGGQPGFFDNMGDRPIRSSHWSVYEIQGLVAEDAERIAFGMILQGRGRAFLDEVELEALDPVPFEPARPLADRALDNVKAFAELFGYVRYFHPSDEGARADWEELAIAGVRAVEPAGSPAELASALCALFQAVAPTVQVYPAANPPEKPAGLSRPASGDKLWLRTWKHHGVGTGSPQSIYASSRSKARIHGESLPAGWRAPADTLIAELDGGVSASLPMVLYADGDGTLPRASAPAAELLPAGFLPSGNDRTTRLADVVLSWNVFQHFYPYFDVVAADWAAELDLALRAAAEDDSERAFLDTLRRMVAALHDGHGGVYQASDGDFFSPPCAWDWIEEELVVTHVDPGAPSGLERGATVLSIDGVPTALALERVGALISGATAQWIRWRALAAVAAGPEGSEVVLELRTPGGEERRVRSVRGLAPSEPRPAKIAELEPGILYVDLDRIADEDFVAALPDLERAHGIVFDLRGYPKSSTIALSHLIDEPIQCARWNVPLVALPDRKGWEFDESRWSIQPSAPRLGAKVAFVTDGRAISYAETYLGMVEHYRLAEIVGGPTAGTNGNVNPFRLPGGYQVSWTGMKVLKHDGSRHHGVGIQPSVPCARTIAGVVAGRDELLERALQVVKD